MTRLAVLLACTLLVSACDSKSSDSGSTAATPTAQTAAQEPAKAESPKQVLEAYYAALDRHDLKTAYGFVSPDDQAAKSFSDYEDAANSEVQKEINKARTFTVGEVKIEGDTARAFVTIQGPDVPKIQQGILGKHIKGGGEMPSTEELKRQMLEKLASPDVPQLTSKQEVFLVNNSGSWALNFDWDKMHNQRDLPDRERPKPTPVPDGANDAP